MLLSANPPSSAPARDHEPLIDGKYGLQELINLEELQVILEQFSRATGFTAGFVAHPSREVLVATGWRKICTKYHRVCPGSVRHCQESNIALTEGLNQLGELNIQLCGNGLVDGATPIVVKGVHLASLATGQVLFAPPDRERFRRQAREFNFDENEYLAALDQVPVVSEEQFKSVLNFLRGIAVMIAELGYQNLLAREQADQLRGKVAQQQATEQALRESEEKFHQLFDTVPEAVLVFDGETRRTVDVNQSALQLYGYTREEFLQLKNTDLRAEPEATGPAVSELLDGPSMCQGERLERRKDGTVFPAAFSACRFLLGGRPVICVLVRDIAERKRVEGDLQKAINQAKAASRAKSTFLANMSHEIRTPMNGVLGMVELLRTTELSRDQRECVQTIYRAGKALMTILNDILDLSKIEAGRMKLDQLPFDLSIAVRDVVELYRPQLENRPVKMTVNFSSAIPRWLLGDPARFRQVLGNLVNNAVKFTHRGHIRIEVLPSKLTADSAAFTIAVQDTGIGIPADWLKALFKPFTQVENQPARQYGGTGLGLANAKRLVELMGGAIRVTSTERVGTTFTIELKLPRAPEDRLEDSATRLAALWRLESTELSIPTLKIPARILLVEDNTLNQTLAARMLVTFGAQVISVNNGREALHKLEQETFDLVFMDCQMPQMDGFQTTAAIRARESRTGGHLPIVAMTAHAMTGDRERCLAAGMDDYLSKPVKISVLHHMLRTWCKTQTAAGPQALPASAPGPSAPPPAQPPERDPPVLDPVRLGEIRNLFDSPTEFVDLVLKPFLVDLSEQLATLSRLAAENLREELEKASHKLKGSASNIGAKNLSLLAAQLHQATHGAKATGFGEMMTRLEAEGGRVRSEIEKMISEA